MFDAGYYTGALETTNAYEVTYEEVVPRLFFESGVGEQAEALGIELTREAVAGYARRVVPPAWLSSTVDEAIREVMPYVKGSSDEFSVQIALDERAHAALAVLRDELRDADVHGALIEHLLSPFLRHRERALRAAAGLIAHHRALRVDSKSSSP